MKEEVGKMKRRCKRLLALFLSVGMLATQFPSVNTTIMADTGTETSDSTSETTGISDDTVIATNDGNYADKYGSECVYIDDYNYDSIFYIIAKKLNKSGSTINLTYGDVKGITEFTISDENTDRYYVNVDNLDKLLPNLTKLTTSKEISGSSSLKLHELNYVGNNDYAGRYVNVSEAFDVSELERISFAGGYINLGDKKYPKLKTLSVTGELNIADYSQLQVIEELKITPYIYKNGENDSYQRTYTDFTQENIAQISKLGTLKQLDLSGNTDLGTGYYDNSTGKYMYLDLSALSGLTGLESLNLSSCELQQFPNIKTLDSLDNLCIYDNKDLVKKLTLKLVPEKFASDDKWVADNFISENEIVTTGDNKSDYYIPDKNLYAYLLNMVDRNSDGMLSVAEAWSVTNLDMGSSYEDRGISAVLDFTGLGDVFKNVTSLTISSYTKWDAQESLFHEIAKFKDMTNLTSYTALYQKSLDTICSDLPELTYLYVYSAGKLDMTNISKLSKLDYLHIGSDIKNAGGINKLNLSRLDMYFDDVKYSDISDVLGGLDYLQMSGNISDDMFDNINKLTNITSLNIYGSSEKNTDKTIDVSSLNKLEDLSISSYGVISKIILPSDNSNLRYLHISGSSFEDKGQTTIENLAKNINLTDLTLNNCGVTDFDEIKNCTKLSSLDISYTGLTKTEGLENLENLYNLEISNNSALEEISGLDKLNKLSTLTISNNDSLSKLSSTCEFSNLTYLYIQDNDNLSEVDFDLGNAANLERIFITENYKLTKVPNGISKLTTLKVLHLQNNALESLPDLSGLCTEKGLLSKGYYWDDYSSYNNKRLEIFGNGFSADDITNAGITGFTDDKNWVALSQTKRTDNGTLLYTGLTEEYILFCLERNAYCDVAVDKDFTLSAEALQYIKGNYAMGCELSVMNADHTLRADYKLDEFTNYYWDGKSDFTFKAPKTESVDGYSKYFDNTPILAYSYDYDFTDHTIGWTTIIGDDDNYGTTYTLNKNTKQASNYQTGICGGDVVIKVPAGTHFINNIDGVSSEAGFTNISDCGIKAAEWVEEEGGMYSTLKLTDEFIKAVDEASNGATIKGYAANSSVYFDYDSDVYKKLRDKNITLDIINGYDGEENTLRVYGESKVTFTNDGDVINYVDTDNPGLYDYGDEEYAPDSLLNGIDYTYLSGNGKNNYRKMYVGYQYPNGTELYLYSKDYANRKYDLVQTAKVAYGYIELTLNSGNSYYLTADKLPKTTWTVDEEWHEIATPDDAERDPDKEDTKKDDTTSDTTDTKKDDTTSDTTDTKKDETVSGTTTDTKTDTSVDTKDDSTKSDTTVTPPTRVVEKTPDDVVLPSIKATKITTEVGVKSAPAKITSPIVKKDEAVSELIKKMDGTVLPKVEVITMGAAPEMTADLFETAKAKNKDITFGVADEDNNLLYSWTFEYDKLDPSKIEGKTMDLSISFASDKQKEIEELTGQDNGIYISINGYHGELPGPATVKTYVGDKYANGETVYLYYYNEETDKVELIGGKGMTVVGGYVEYTLTHCSTYFITPNTPESYGIDTKPKNTNITTDTTNNVNNTNNVAPAPTTAVQQPSQTPAKTAPKQEKTNKSTNTGDNGNVELFVIVAMFGLALAAYGIRRKKHV